MFCDKIKAKKCEESFENKNTNKDVNGLVGMQINTDISTSTYIHIVSIFIENTITSTTWKTRA